MINTSISFIKDIESKGRYHHEDYERPHWGRESSYPEVYETVDFDVPKYIELSALWANHLGFTKNHPLLRQYIIYNEGIRLEHGEHFDYALEGYAIVFRKPIVGPTKLHFQLQPELRDNLQVCLLQKHSRSFIFTDEKLQELAGDALYKIFPFEAKSDIYAGYRSMYVTKTWIESDGLWAKVQLGY